MYTKMYLWRVHYQVVLLNQGRTESARQDCRDCIVAKSWAACLDFLNNSRDYANRARLDRDPSDEDLPYVMYDIVSVQRGETVCVPK